MDLELESQRAPLATKDDLARELGRFDLAFRTALAEFRSETNERFAEMRNRFHALELQIQTQRADTARWILGSSGTIVGAFGVILGLFYFFTNRLGK